MTRCKVCHKARKVKEGRCSSCLKDEHAHQATQDLHDAINGWGRVRVRKRGTEYTRRPV